MYLKLIFLLMTLAYSISAMQVPTSRIGIVPVSQHERRRTLAAVMPGDSAASAVLFQGLSNGFSLFSQILLFRVALSWFPQLPRQFPILRPVFTVTEPYLAFFRRQIPAIGGFDISALPAFFVLDIMSQVRFIVFN
jgi:YggT family protein